jgi:hypothetical protein
MSAPVVSEAEEYWAFSGLSVIVSISSSNIDMLVNVLREEVHD